MDPRCSFCGTEDETLEHIVLKCPWVHYVWYDSRLSYHPNNQGITSLDRWLLCMATIGSSSLRDTIWLYVGVICWEIWKERCHAIFMKVAPNPIFVLARCNSMYNDITNIHTRLPSIVSQEDHYIHRWIPLVDRNVKVNVDGAWNSSMMETGVGVVIRNSSGELICGESSFLKRASVEEVEAEAVLTGMKLASTKNFQHVMIESDSIVVIEAINCPSHSKIWRIYPIIVEIRRLASHFSSVTLTWTSRSSNRAAHLVAALGNSRVRHFQWASMPPPSLVLVLSHDGLLCPPSLVV
ncbi:hypothetical protein FF2_045907 [Malus domestica]